MNLNPDLLEKCADDELRAIVAKCEELLALHDRQRKDKALEQARAILSGAGLNLRDIAGGKPHKNGGKAPVYRGGRQYQHPSDKALTWNAKGQKPTWLRELEASGGKALEVGNG